MNLKLLYLILLLIPCALFANVSPPILFPPEELLKKELSNSKIPYSTQEKKERIPTYWGGGTLSQEEREISGVTMTVYILAGSAWFFRKDMEIYADKIEVVGQDAIKAYLIGSVRILDKENGTLITSKNGEYDKFEDLVVTEGRPKLTHENKNKEKTIVTSKSIKRFFAKKTTNLEGEVIIISKENHIFCNNAEFSEETNELKTDQNPIILGNNLYAIGNSLSYNSKEETVSLEGNSFLIRRSFSEKKEDQNAENNGTKENLETKQSESDLREEKITYMKGDLLKSYKNEESDPVIGLFGNAEVFNENYEFQADQVESTGEDSEIVIAKNNIRMFDIKSNLILGGELLEYFKLEDYVHLTENPKIQFLKKDSNEVSATLTAIEMERYLDTGETLARGNVRIEGQETKVFSEYATYYEEDESIIMKGNTRIERDGKVIHSGEILMYPRENRLKLTNKLNLEEVNSQ